MTTDEKAMAYTARIVNQTDNFTKGEVETAFVTGYKVALREVEELLYQDSGNAIDICDCIEELILNSKF